MKNDMQTMAILCHVLGIPASFVGALIFYIIAKDSTLKKHATSALNWQLTLLIFYAAIFIPSLFLGLVGNMLFIGLSAVNIVFCVLAAIDASNGKLWNYPLSIKILKK